MCPVVWPLARPDGVKKFRGLPVPEREKRAVRRLSVRLHSAETEYQKMPAQKGNRSKKKLSNRAGSKKAALKRRRARERRK